MHNVNSKLETSANARLALELELRLNRQQREQLLVRHNDLKRLLAHELFHTTQQRQPTLWDSCPESRRLLAAFGAPASVTESLLQAWQAQQPGPPPSS